MKKLFLLFLLLILSISAFANITFPDFDCDKICYKPGETVNCYADVVSDRSCDATITWYVYKDINNKKEYKTETLHLLRDFPTRALFSFSTDEKDMWGYEVEFVVNDGESDYSDCVYYCVGNKPQVVGHYGRTCNRCSYTFDEALDTVRLAFKSGHYTVMEWFSWQPSCWEAMAPKEDAWVSGQTGFIAKKDYIKALIEEAHKLGMSALTYDIKFSWGYKGAEFIREHFDWWNYDKFGNPFPNMNTYDISVMDQTLDFMHTGEYECKVSPQWIWWDSGVLLNDEMKDLYLNQIKESIEMFGWDGVRQDGIAEFKDVYNREGKLVKANPKFKDKANWIRYARKWMKENIGPDCEMDFNAGSVEYPLEKTDPEIFKAMAEDDSYVLWEGVTYCYQKTNELNNLNNLIYYANLESKAAREAGGYRYAMQGLGSNEILEAVFTACGIKTDRQPAQDPPFKYRAEPERSFNFRYGEYFWNNKLKRVENATDFISVDNDNILWKDTVQYLEKGRKKYYIVHLINHAKDFSATTWPEEEYENIKVSIDTVDFVNAYVLSPDFGEKNSFVVKAEEDAKNITVPKLKIWDVVVFETQMLER
ncbi:MAG: hypothetical protein IJS60_04550 [Abditibacteriota bacterium]|nr:hypothetical protein [Abditibacteriota bacterium]